MTLSNFRENYTTNFFARYEMASSSGVQYADRRYRRLRQRVARQVLRRFLLLGMTDR